MKHPFIWPHTRQPAEVTTDRITLREVGFGPPIHAPIAPVLITHDVWECPSEFAFRPVQDGSILVNAVLTLDFKVRWVGL